MKTLNIVLLVFSKTRLLELLNKLFKRAGLEKKIKLLQLKGFDFGRLSTLGELFYKEMIKPNLIGPLIKEMQRLMQQEYEIYIVSAGYSIYLRYFAEEYQITHFIATEIAFRNTNNRCKGTISGKDCIHVEKVHRLKKSLPNTFVDYNESIAYSDCITDLPMLLLTGRGVVVSRDISQTWRHNYNLEEIIWKEN